MMTIKNIFAKKHILWVVALLILLIAAFVVTQLVFGGFGLSKKAWKALAKELPLPAVLVNNKPVPYSAIETAEHAGIDNPITYAAQHKAVEILAEQHGLTISDEAVDEERQYLISLWQINALELDQQLSAMNISEAAFGDILKYEARKKALALKLNEPNQKVEDVKNQLEANADFPTLARNYSDDPVTAPLGGEAGYVSVKTIDSKIWQKAASMADGQIAGPVQTPSGYAFIERVGKNPKVDQDGDQLRLRVIYIKTFDVNSWIEEQYKTMKIKVLI